MKFSHIVCAIAALSAGSAMATTPGTQIALSSGSSASGKALASALKSLCTSAGGTLLTYATKLTYVSGQPTLSGDYQTFVCETGVAAPTSPTEPTAANYAASHPVNFSGTTFAEVRAAFVGGSFTAVCSVEGWPTGTACPVPDQYVDPTQDGGAFTDTSGTSSVNYTNYSKLAAAPAGADTVGGLMDVEPEGFDASALAGIPLYVNGQKASANFYQEMAIVASADLYAKMYADQYASGLIPTSCGTTATTNTANAACIPTVGKAQMAALLSAQNGGNISNEGAYFLAPSQYTNGATTLTLAARPLVSGTVAASLAYFLGDTCNPQALATNLEIAAGATIANPVKQTSNKLVIQQYATTTDLRQAIITNGTTSTPTIGLMSAQGEKTGIGAFYFLRLAGVSPTENAAQTSGVTNTVNALNGKYDFVAQSYTYTPGADANAQTLWSQITASFPTGSLSSSAPGLFYASETPYNAGSSICQPYAQ